MLYWLCSLSISLSLFCPPCSDELAQLFPFLHSRPFFQIADKLFSRIRQYRTGFAAYAVARHFFVTVAVMPLSTLKFGLG